MKLSIYLGEDEIRAVLGRCRKQIEIKDCLKLHLKKGALINDLVVEEEPVREALWEIAKRFSAHSGHIHLMLGGNEIVTRVMVVPPMTGKQMSAIARHELTPLLPDFETCDYIYDYSVIRHEDQKNKGKTILCAAVRRSVIEEYQKLFRSCGLKLESVDVAVDRLSCMTGYLPIFRKKTFVLAFAAGRSLSVSMFVDGIYSYSNWLRLVEERGTDECMEEIEQSILSVMRFYRMQKEEYVFEFVCLCGLSEEEQQQILPSVDGIEVLIPKLEGIVCGEGTTWFALKDFFYTTAGLVEDKGCMNLLGTAGRHLKIRLAGFAKGVLVLILPMLLTGLLLADSAAGGAGANNMENQIKTGKEGLEAGKSAYERARASSRELMLLESYDSACKSIASQNQQTAVMSRSIYETVMEQAATAIAIHHVKMEDKILSIQGMSSGYEVLTDYVIRLEQLGVFAEVNYNGFSNINPVTGSRDAGCYFTLSCTLKGGGT